MAHLTDTRVEVTDEPDYRIVAFETNEGQVEFIDDGTPDVQVGWESVDAAGGRDILDAVAGHEDMPERAVELAREILDAIDGGSEDDEGNTEAGDSDDQDGETVHVTEDGVEIRVGDRINHPGGWSYEITGRADEHTLRKMDNTDDWGVSVSTVERDIQDHGFSERVDG